MPTNQQIPKMVKLEPDIVNRLKKLSKIKHQSPHWMMQEAIKYYIEREEYKERLNQEALDRWKEAEQGNVVSHESVSIWIDSWGTNDESDRPLCGS